METPLDVAAPIVRRPRSSSLVIISGLATTAITLLGVYLLNVFAEDFNVMGWYANYVIPIGALIVGVAASSGYGLASWFSGIKITRSLLWTVLALQIVAYFAAQYIEFKSQHLVFRDTGKPIGFVEYFDAGARSFTWKQKDGSQGEPLGLWGYLFRGLEIAGFAAGGLIVPGLMRKAPYCEPCQRYMRTKPLAFIPASVPLKKIKKSDTAAQAAHDAEQTQAGERGQAILEATRKLVAEGKAGEFQNALAELKAHQKEVLKLPRRVSLRLVSCLGCSAGRVEAALLLGQANQIQQTELGGTDAPADFIQIVRQAK